MVFGFLIVIGGVQHRWAIISAGMEITQIKLRIFSTVIQTMALEHRKLVPLNFTDIIQFENVKPQMDEVVDTMSLLSRAKNTVLQFTDGEWLPLERGEMQDLSSILRQWKVRQDSEKSLEGYIDISSQGKAQFFIHSSDNPRKGVLLRFNYPRFIDTYIIPALEEILPNYRFSYISGDKIPQFESRHARIEPMQRDLQFEKRTPTLGTLFSSLIGKNEKFYLYLSDGEIQLSGREKHAFRPTRGEYRVRPFDGRESPGALLLTGDGDSPLSSVKRRMALNWLVGQSLILSVGGAFILVLFHWNRLRQQRNKEREFVASVSHELRTPLAVLQSAADNLHDGMVPAHKVQNYGNIMLGQTQQLSAMIEELLTLAEMDGGRNMKSVLREISPEELRGHLLSSIPPTKDDAEQMRVHIDFEKLPNPMLIDFEALIRILGNLLNNALLHSDNENGEVFMTAHWNKEKIQFIVEDDGIGIPKKEQKHLFTAFYRGQRTRDKQIRGFGLGLHIAKRSAKTMGGILILESPYLDSDGGDHPGCRFILEFPYSEKGVHMGAGNGKTNPVSGG